MDVVPSLDLSFLIGTIFYVGSVNNFVGLVHALYDATVLLYKNNIHGNQCDHNDLEQFDSK